MFFPLADSPPHAKAPDIFPTPFAQGSPHPLAKAAAEQLQATLATHPAFPQSLFRGEFGGKMFGVLVVRDAQGRLGYLRAFAGMVEDAWTVEGFAPPLFDVAAFEALWLEGGAEISRLDAQIKGLQGDADAERARAATQAQREASRSLHAKLHATYRVTNARGETTSLRQLFEPRIPPGGAGDCAAPKLLAQAYDLGLRPIALAEFWWGAPPPGGGRRHGVYYPACRGRCAKILPHMLQGIEAEPQPDVGMKAVPDEAPTTVFEDAHIIVVDKPAGLLSVPGRGPTRQDCAERRLQARAGLPDPTWPRVAHRLDLATSGLLVAAKDRETYVALQRQFSARSVQKCYVAVLRGALASDKGTVDLALARDLSDRPRQKHDPEQGKPSLTHWRVLERVGHTTRVELRPQTGRTHQLRLHAAHPLGLNAPIVGDWLYGFGGERLLLHAQRIEFAHPHTGTRVSFESACPF